MPEIGLTIPCSQAEKWTKNDVRPLHVFLGNDTTGAARTCWECPFCKLQFLRRKPCEKHMGMVTNILPSCHALKSKDKTKETEVRENFANLLLSDELWEIRERNKINRQTL